MRQLENQVRGEGNQGGQSALKARWEQDQLAHALTKSGDGVRGAGADVSGAGTFITGRPTVAPNAGASLQSKNLRGFAACDLSMAEWCRLPAPRARCVLTGLSRTGLNELIEAGHIRAITVRKPGAVRGVKLINLASLRTWLHRLDEEQNGPVEG